ncbi:hypothetical protein C100_12320 [Sphingobium sp. C100]|nr:hypothetical protein C100_12320 [Sphingobium sp. C100]
MRKSPEDPSWTAPRTGMDWRDDVVLLATAWLAELANGRTWAARIAATRDRFLLAKTEWGEGRMVPLYDPKDTAAWYVFQANAYAADRLNWVPEEAVRMVPTFTRIGEELPKLLEIPGAEARAARLMNADRSQPDGGLFELLVALAYRRAGWDTRFVTERPGIAKTPDLFVSKGRRRWAVECKRMDRSSYQSREKARGEMLANAVHALALANGRSIAMTVVIDAELADLPDDYLVRRAASYFEHPRNAVWADEAGMGVIEEIDWSLARRVLAVDDVYFGSSRMIELLLGGYDHDFSHTMAGQWRPAPERPFWASALYQASVVSWRNVSIPAIRKKARHFRSVVAGATKQLPKDRPGVVHVGVESWSGGDVDGARHIFNKLEMLDFDPVDTRLRWVYGEYIAPEVTTRSDESWAIEETSASYRVGRHGTAEPLPNHMLLTPEHSIKHGVHWDPVSQRPLKRF